VNYEIGTTHVPHPVLKKVGDQEVVFWILIGLLASGWISISMPQRGMPGANVGLDLLAIAKLAIRAAILSVGVWLGLRLIANKDSATRFYCHRGTVALSILMPWFAFLAWAFLSALWSPLKSVSIGQAAGLASMLVLTIVVAVFAQSRRVREQILAGLNLMFIGFSGFTITLHCIWPEASGMIRDYSLDGATGVVHPTAAGANASLGLVFAFWNWLRIPVARSRVLCAFTMALHLGLLILSHSRSALGMLLFTVGLGGVWGLNLQAKGRWLVSLSVAGLLLIIMDPGFGKVQSMLESIFEFLARGQSADQIQQVSGRAEMWAMVWKEYLGAIWFGHGYFVTSASGTLDVWHAKQSYTAHNVVLQLLVSTGLIGTAIFLWGGVRILGFLAWPSDAVRQTPCSELARETGWLRFLGFLSMFWFAGWSIGCESFLGPVRTESVFFYTLLGLCLACQISGHLDEKFLRVGFLSHAQNKGAVLA
jgi:O-antigen ligase